MPHTKVTPKTLAEVLIRLGREVLSWDYVGQKLFCADFDLFLTELANQDAFGTEGQCDPRGDQRNN